MHRPHSFASSPIVVVQNLHGMAMGMGKMGVGTIGRASYGVQAPMRQDVKRTRFRTDVRPSATRRAEGGRWASQSRTSMVPSSLGAGPVVHGAHERKRPFGSR